MGKQPIGVFDSGVGGLTIWQEMARQLPTESTLYLADSKHAPYGKKQPEEIYQLARRITSYLISQQAKLIVIACNTITVSAVEQLRWDFPQVPIIGTVPVIKLAAAKTRNGNIGVLSTTATKQSSYYKDLIDQFAQGKHVITVGIDTLVPFIEQGRFGDEKLLKILTDILKPFQQENIDTLVLGCSHFPFIEKHIRQIVGDRVLLLDSSEAIARQVKRILSQNQIIENQGENIHRMETTGDTVMFKNVMRQLASSYTAGTIQEVKQILL